MQPGQIEKVKKLIHTSGILTSEERAEWLALLEIMNDKQVLELERILLSHETPHQTSPAPVHSVTGSGPAGAPLHHIMNVPPSLMSEPHDRPAGARGGEVQEEKFAEEVRHILEEKELPTSKPEFPLEIPGHALQEKPAGQVQAKPVIAPPPIKSSVPLSAFAKPASTPSRPVVNPPATDSKGEKKRQPGHESASPKEPLFHAELHSWEDIERFVKKNTASTPAATNTPDAVFSKVLQKQTGVKPFVETHVPELKENEVPSHPTVTKTLWDESDPSLLSISVFQKVDLRDLINRLKKQVSSRGYHAVLFQLEKSLLYKMYLETGSKLLGEGNSFEKLQKEAGTLGKKYMDRREFENFTDLLREIQIG